MVYFTMFFTHMFKAAEYYLIEDIPRIPLEHIPYVPEEIFWQFAKIVEIYFSLLGC